MIRFFTKPENITKTAIRLTAEDAEHMRSLRLQPDERFIVCDGNNTDYICRLGEHTINDKSQDDTPMAHIIEQRESQGEPTVKCSVYIAYQKGERLDYAVQKSVELGASEIVLYASERCVSIPKNVQKRTERYQRIALETAKQCGRGIIPAVSSVGDFKSMLNMAVSHSELTLLCYEDEKKLHIKTVLGQKSFASIAIITGPEGGFSTSEVNLAQSMSIPIVTLGPRILRSETAPVAALAVLMYQTDNM